MIPSRWMYRYVTGDLDKIEIAGDIMTRRSHPEQIRGEDIAFIQEATRYRELARGMSGLDPVFGRQLSLDQLNLAIERFNGFMSKPILFDSNLSFEEAFYREALTSENPLTASEWTGKFAGNAESIPFMVDKQPVGANLDKAPILKMLNGLPKFSRVVRKATQWSYRSSGYRSNEIDFMSYYKLKKTVDAYLDQADFTDSTTQRTIPPLTHFNHQKTLIYGLTAYAPYFSGAVHGRIYNYVSRPWDHSWTNFDYETNWRVGQLGENVFFNAQENTSSAPTMFIEGIDSGLFRSVVPIYKIKAQSYHQNSNGEYWRVIPSGLDKKMPIYEGWVVGRQEYNVATSGYASLNPAFDIRGGFLPASINAPSPVYGNVDVMETAAANYVLLTEYSIDIEDVYYIGRLHSTVTEV